MCVYIYIYTDTSIYYNIIYYNIITYNIIPNPCRRIEGIKIDRADADGLDREIAIVAASRRDGSRGTERRSIGRRRSRSKGDDRGRACSRLTAQDHGTEALTAVLRVITLSSARLERHSRRRSSACSHRLALPHCNYNYNYNYNYTYIYDYNYNYDYDYKSICVYISIFMYTPTY